MDFPHLPLCHVTFPPARRKYYRLGQSNPKKILGCTIYKAHPISENLLNIMRKLAIFVYLVMLMMGHQGMDFSMIFLRGLSGKLEKYLIQKYIYTYLVQKHRSHENDNAILLCYSACTLYVGR